MMDAQRGRTRASEGLARRGLLAGVAALVAGGLARLSERVAGATDGSPLIVGQNNTSATGTSVSTSLPAGVTASAFVASNSKLAPGCYGLFGFLNGFGDGSVAAGVGGTSNGGHGLYGASSTNSAQAPAYGVLGRGLGTSIGVRGECGVSLNGSTIGVLGVSAPAPTDLAAPNAAAGVYGLSNGSQAGVVGQSNNGVGCQGASNGNVGVLGQSNVSVGVFASSGASTGLSATSTSGSGIVASTNSGNAIQGASNGNVGVLGTSQSSIGGFFSSGTSTGLYATGPGAGFAARFDGPVQVNGAFTVVGGPKSAAVPHPDGSHRRLYCVESPESWFEDFGRGRLQEGRARVRLDPDFDALVHGDDYYVFLTESGDYGGLYVSQRAPHSFEVRARKGGAEGPFDYRVVAKRKDISGARLERVDVSAAAPRVPAPPAPPTVPAMPPLPEVRPSAPGNRDAAAERSH